MSLASERGIQALPESALRLLLLHEGPSNPNARYLPEGMGTIRNTETLRTLIETVELQLDFIKADLRPGAHISGRVELGF